MSSCGWIFYDQIHRFFTDIYDTDDIYCFSDIHWLLTDITDTYRSIYADELILTDIY